MCYSLILIFCKWGVVMKKLWFKISILTFLLILVGCNNILLLNTTEDESYLLDPEFSIQVDERDGFRVSHSRNFYITPYTHGYIATALLEYMNDFLPYRLAFSDNELRAAEWIVATLHEMGFDDSQIAVQQFYLDAKTSSWWGNHDIMVGMFHSSLEEDTAQLIETSQNIILTLPGLSEKTIVIGAHYDSVDNAGISDNASGTVLLLETAYHMSYIEHYYTLQFVFFGAEEVGLVGSFYFTDNMTDSEIENLVFMINADVIIDGPELVFSAGYIENLPDTRMNILFEGALSSQNAITKRINEIADELNDEATTNLISKPRGILLPSDHLAFVEFGIPVVVFYSTHEIRYPELFFGDVLHSKNDNLDFIMENHSGRVQQALFEFGIFLETILSRRITE